VTDVTDIESLQIVSAESGALVEARSSVGRISFGSTSLTGGIEAPVVDGAVDTAGLTSARVVIPVTSLVSDNAMYDNELRARLNAQRYPDIVGELTDVRDLGSGRVALSGELTVRGDRRTQHGTATITSGDTDHVSVTVEGTAVIDMRDYDIKVPKVLMLRIYPEVNLRFRITAKRAPTSDGGK